MPNSNPEIDRANKRRWYHRHAAQLKEYRDALPRKTDRKRRPMMGLTTTPEGRRAYRRMWYRENRERVLFSNKLWKVTHG